jgi:hypothetical protein
MPTLAAGSSARKLERKFTMSPEAAQRLAVHAAGTGLRPSQVVEQLVLTHLRRFVLTDRGELDQVEPQIAAVTGDGSGRAGQGREAA